MQVHEKRKLLEAIEILVKRPAQANEQTLGEAIGYFTLLIEDLTQEKLTVICMEKKK